eukprot:Platyproteum_vivax@DN9212_c0_g1_i1.p1
MSEVIYSYINFTHSPGMSTVWLLLGCFVISPLMYAVTSCTSYKSLRRGYGMAKRRGELVPFVDFSAIETTPTNHYNVELPTNASSTNSNQEYWKGEEQNEIRFS